jgi:hypothetical protein
MEHVLCSLASELFVMFYIAMLSESAHSTSVVIE